MTARAFSELSSLNGRVAAVTGACGGIGRATCQMLADMGAHILAVDLDAEACRQLAHELEDVSGVKAIGITCDLADIDGLAAIPSQAEEAFGGLDILVNGAALVGTSELKGWAVPFEEQRVEAWRAAMDINLGAPFFLTQACTALLRRSGHASVVNLSSIYGDVGPDWGLYEGTDMANPAAYGASKGGLNQITRWLATRLAPDVRVNAVSIGGVARGQPETFVRRYEKRTPLGRMACEGDVASAIAYLSCDLSSYVTGHVLAVDGGWTVW